MIDMDQQFSRLVSVSAMDGDERRSAERLLGHPLDNDRQLYILAFKPHVANDDTRQKALANLRQTFAATERHAEKQGVSETEIDEAVDEAMNAVRYGRP
ncbi:MAG TPA: hypothetical protein PK867_01840 [Pirellulales bacterium]|nr:hypothetical protein [Pirellulales bacterium]